MYQQIRLYPKTEPDLMALRLFYGAGFQRIVYQCVESVLSGGAYTIHFPKDFQEELPSSPLIVALKFKDENVNLFLRSVRFRLKGCVIKEMVRSCYDQFPFWLFQETSGSSVPHLDMQSINPTVTTQSKTSQNGKHQDSSKPIPVAQKTVAEASTAPSALPPQEQAHEPIPESTPSSEATMSFDITQLLDSLVQM